MPFVDMYEETEGEKFVRKYGVNDFDAGYVGECPNCGRSRLLPYSKGFHICEKYNWCVEENNYCWYEPY